MLNRRRAVAGVLLVLLVLAGSFAVADDADTRIEKLEREVQTLRDALDAARGGEPDGARLDEIERKIEVLVIELESLRTGQPVAVADNSAHGLGPAASKIYGVERGVSIGGYGELLYKNADSTLDNGAPNGEGDTLDFLRAVFYFGYKFNDRFLFNSEIEFEHGSTEEDGEVSVEFAYLDFLWRESLNVRAGLLLLPMGWVNELHEPTVFLGTMRPETERRILPSTWRESGVGIFGEAGPFSYRSYVVNGFDATGFASDGLRGGRQNGSKSKAEDFAWTGRLDYVGRPGLIVGVSAYLGDSGQDLEDAMGSIDVATSIVEAHVDWRFRGFELRALGARGALDDVARLNQALGLVGNESIGETLVGGYMQAGYDVLLHRGAASRLVPYVRWERLNTQHAVPAGFVADPATETRIRTLGVAYQPIRQIVIKAEIEDRRNEAGTGFGRFNASLGYVF